jgi:hypothetical protein
MGEQRTLPSEAYETKGMTTTDAAQADITQLPASAAWPGATLYGDKACYKAVNQLHWECGGGACRVNKSGTRSVNGDRI